MGQIEGSIGPYINAGTPVDGTDEVQTITPSAAPASGTFRLVFDGFKTTLLAWNVSAAAMQTALNLLSSIGTSGVAVALNGGVYSITFSGANLAKRAQNLITVEDNTVLDAGAAAVTLTVAEDTPGVGATAMGALKGALLIDTTNGVLYINSGTAAAPVWQNFIPTDVLSAPELEVLNGAPFGAAFVIGAEGGNAINVGIQLKDADGVNLAVRGMVKAYLSDDAAGDSLAAAAPSGGCAIGTDGVLMPLTPALSNALMVDGNLAIDATAEKFKTTQTAAFLINGVSHVKAAAIEQVFSAAHVITASKFGVILVQINAAGTISTKVPASPQAYDDALTALAALPAVDAGNVALGYIAIENNAGDWTANTDDLTDASDVTTAAFTDASETAIGAAKAFELVSEADGDIDININEAGVATWYLILQLPNGKLVPSGAITFA